jgi:hypothetical protein
VNHACFLISSRFLASAAEAYTLGKHVADASSSDNDRKDGSKNRKTDEVTADGEEARLILVDNTASSTVVDSNDVVMIMVLPFITRRKPGAGSFRTWAHQETAMMSLAPRKKLLLILNLNGQLADINQDKHNAHL